jgi:hypothetical protein
MVPAAEDPYRAAGIAEPSRLILPAQASQNPYYAADSVQRSGPGVEPS